MTKISLLQESKLANYLRRQIEEVQIYGECDPMCDIIGTVLDILDLEVDYSSQEGADEAKEADSK